ncbi:MAG: VWA domain-containing protein [Thaumarchaeota archaeon]|nr:MAG: VWA domain-containing protein [Nitrososphaerota archaeon]
MLLSSTKNFVYFLSESNQSESSESQISNEKLTQILKTIAKQALKEKTTSLQALEQVLQGVIQESSSEYQLVKDTEQEMDLRGSNEPITKYLQKLGYLKDEKKWLTNKAFFEIGQRLLEDTIKAINEGGFGFHETSNLGTGNIILDTTRKLELGDDIKNLDVSGTILNSVKRVKSKKTTIEFPLQLEFDDFEKFETKEEVKVTVVYCIDLSSTMKYSLTSGEGSRIEAAKRALWALYVLNKKFFPNDSIYVVGFGSLASEVKPHDIPYLKTYDANDNFLHYTNYQAAFRLALRILKKDGAHNKRIVLITDGQPSACFIDDESQQNAILSDKPYSHFYKPDETTLSKMKEERNVKLDIGKEMVYLCYRYRQVDPAIEAKTLQEAKKCKREGIEIDTIMVSEEADLLKYVENLEKYLKGRAYYINPEKIDRVLITDFISNKKKILNSRHGW